MAQALLEETGRARLLPSFLKMVAIATIADAVPLLGENRVFARLGLEGLRKPVNAGLHALLANCELGRLASAERQATSPSAWRRGSTPPGAWTWPNASSGCSPRRTRRRPPRWRWN